MCEFGDTGHRSLLASSGVGGEGGGCNLKYTHLTSRFFFNILIYYTLNLEALGGTDRWMVSNSNHEPTQHVIFSLCCCMLIPHQQQRNPETI